MAFSKRISQHANLSNHKNTFTNQHVRKLRCEHLEDRRLLAVVTVDTVEDVVDFSDGVTSLREAIFAANTVAGADEIAFDFEVDGPVTIRMTEGEFLITDTLTITGSGQELLTIDAQQQSRIFNIDDPNTEEEEFNVTLVGLTLTGGLTTGDNVEANQAGIFETTFNGGAIRSLTSGELAINQSTISNSRTEGTRAAGGAISARPSTLVLSHSRIDGNSTSGEYAWGGGIGAGSIILTSSVISDNHTMGHFSGGGGILGTIATLTDTKVLNNSTYSEFARGGGVGAGYVTLLDSTVSGNNTRGERSKGGGVYAFFEFESNKSIISGNSTLGDSAHGGGVSAREKLILIDSVVSSNRTEGDFSGGGGITAGDVEITRSHIINNSTSGDLSKGGGINAFGIFADIEQSKISGNETTGVHSGGGGIYAHQLLTIHQSTVSGNRTTGYYSRGGGIDTNRAPLWITQSTISDNSTAGKYARGGGLFADHSLELTQSTISSNSTSGEEADGGGIFSHYSKLLHSTLTGNSTHGRNSNGGAIATYDSRGNTTLDHSIVAGNHDDSGVADDIAGIVSSSYSLIGTGAESLGPLADNGGPTFTHALLPNSPAIDAGEHRLQSSENELQEFDQRGTPFARIAGFSIDIGAYESQSRGGFYSADFDNDRDTDGADFLAWQRGHGINSGAEQSDGDANRDGEVNQLDLAVWLEGYLQAANTPQSVEQESIAFKESSLLVPAIVELSLADYLMPDKVSVNYERAQAEFDADFNFTLFATENITAQHHKKSSQVRMEIIKAAQSPEQESPQGSSISMKEALEIVFAAL